MAACDCNIRFTYQFDFGEGYPFTFTEVLSPEATLINGRSYYETHITNIDYSVDPYVKTTKPIRIYWDSTSNLWTIIALDTWTTGFWDTNDVLSTLNLDQDCPTSTTAWTRDFTGFTYIQTSLECETTQICTTWATRASEPNPLLNQPCIYDPYIFAFTYNDPTQIHVGAPVTILHFDVPTTSTLGATIAFLVYQDTNTPTLFYLEPGINRDLIGAMLYGNNGLLLPTNYNGSTSAPNYGYICFSIYTAPTQQEIDEECFNILVWDKQCEFGKNVYDYLLKLNFGIANCEALECLKNQRRVLKILNCYDTRDLGTIVPQYNALSYNTIKKLLD
jgi:hypothetical protein